MRLAPCASLVLIVACALGCKQDRSDAPPRPQPTTPSPAPSPTPSPTPSPAPIEPPPIARPAGPLDPVRVEAATASRAALEVMTRSIGCPQKLPSTFARYCLAAAEFESGTAAEIPEGDTLLVGVGAIIAPGPPSVSTLGTGMPLVMRLHRAGASISAKQIGLRDPGEPDALPVIAARIGKTLDGAWDHVDVPAAFKPQFEGLAEAQLDPLEAAGNSYWPKDLDGLELRRANNRWIGVGSPEGPAGRHVILLFVEHHKLLGPKEKSPQQITVLKL